MLYKVMASFIVIMYCFFLCAWDTNFDQRCQDRRSKLYNSQEAVDRKIANTFDVNLSLYFDDVFSDESRRLLVSSVNHFLDVGLGDLVIDCAFSESSNEPPMSKEEFRRQLASIVSKRTFGRLSVPSDLQFLADSAGSFQRTSVVCQGNNLSMGVKYLTVVLNKIWVSTLPSTRYWSAVIAHQLLHNLGFREFSDGSSAFIDVYTKCFQTLGDFENENFVFSITEK